MIGIVSDQDIQGLASAVISRCRQPDWDDVWTALDVELFTFADLGLEPDATDARIWRICQQNGIVLLTGNRNAEGTESLEATIRAHNDSTSLPVVTFADLRRLKLDRDYLELAAERLMEVMIDIESLRGAGRLYLP